MEKVMSMLQGQLKKTQTYIAILIVMIFLSGCKNPMALNKKLRSVDLSKNSIALFTLRTSNEFKPSFTPNVDWFEIINASSKKYRKFFKVDKAHAKSSKFNEYLVSVDVEPGKRTLGRVVGGNNVILVMASFAFAVNGTFEIPPKSVTYIGHIDMNNRERKKGEPRSGPIAPLLDQAVAGYSGGTFDVTISDRSASDIPLFTQTYPCLKDIQIGKALMQK